MALSAHMLESLILQCQKPDCLYEHLSHLSEEPSLVPMPPWEVVGALFIPAACHCSSYALHRPVNGGISNQDMLKPVSIMDDTCSKSMDALSLPY